MRHIKLFNESNIEKRDFPFEGHNLSPRERKIISDLVGNYLNLFNIKVEDHYYYSAYPYDVRKFKYNVFDNFNELRDYVISIYYISLINKYNKIITK